MDYEFLEINKQEEKHSDTRFVSIQEFRNELAIHEASHFVFHQLLSKNLTENYQIGYVVICAENLTELNKVNFKRPEYYETYGDHSYFIKDRRRLVAHLLNLIAGYSSYQEFISRKEFYIFSQINNQNNDNLEIKYYSLEYSSYSGATDFRVINELLKTYYPNLNYRNQIEILARLTCIAQTIMGKGPVKKSIHLVKDALLKNQCNKIEGDELETLKESVNELISDLDFTGILEELKDEIKY